MNHICTYSQTEVRQGGLMRCCIETIRKFIDLFPDEEAKDMLMDCRHVHAGNRQIKLVDGIWSWNEKSENIWS